MAEQELKLEGLRNKVRKAVSDFAGRLIEALGENLKSITVVGSSLTEDFVKGKSDINTVLVLEQQNMACLESIADMGKEMSRKKLSAPLLMTEEYIKRSLDVFSVEFLNLQLNHQTIYGDDPFSELRFERRDVRFQCEREFKATLIRLRQGYISSAGNRSLIRDSLSSAANSLVPLLRAVLWLKGLEVPRRADYVMAEAGQTFLIDADAVVEEARKWRYKKAQLTSEELSTAFEKIYELVDKLAGIVDKLEV
ncbi:MAG: hypothetical protein ACYSSP_05170 [Planctomycetota bacterium]|jgi:hypothetical protein